MPIEYFLFILVLFFVYLFWRDRNLNRLLDLHWTETSEHLEDARTQSKRLAKRERQLLNILLFKKQNPTLDDSLQRLPADTRKEPVPGVHTTQEEIDVLENDIIQEAVEERLDQWLEEQKAREVTDEEKTRMVNLFTEQAIEKYEAEKLTK